MKNYYLLFTLLLIIMNCNKEKPDYADKPDTHTYHYLTQEQLNKTPYFTNPAFDTLTFLSNANDTLIFAKLKTDTFYHKTSRSDCPDCPVHYSYYQELHKTYQTIKGNGKFEVSMSLIGNTRAYPYTIYDYFEIKINNWSYTFFIPAVNYVNYKYYLGNIFLNNTSFKDCMFEYESNDINKKNIGIHTNSHGLVLINDSLNNFNFNLIVK